jgi:transposase InsO family protein
VSRYRFIEAEKTQCAVTTLCRVLQVSRAAYYDWSCAAPSTRALANGELLEKIRTIHARSRMTYGAPRVHDELRTAGVCCSRKRPARLMRQNGIAGRHPKRFRRTTVSNPFTALPDLVQRNFAPADPDQLWVTDITYARTGEGWLYLAVVLDCFSRRVVGWAMQDNLGSELTLAAMRMALLQRQPRPGLIHHSDRGCQYTSDAYEKLLAAHDVLQSVTRPGNCYDTGTMTSFKLLGADVAEDGVTAFAVVEGPA